MSPPSSPKGLAVESSKQKLRKQYNEILLDDVNLERTRQLLYEYAGKGLVDKMDDKFFEGTASIIDLGDDKVRVSIPLSQAQHTMILTISRI